MPLEVSKMMLVLLQLIYFNVSGLYNLNLILLKWNQSSLTVAPMAEVREPQPPLEPAE